jgi:ubiquinone/menaquinone biosynthesis C-methylase UbiE
MTTEMADYYDRRAAEFESIYARPERQSDLERLRAWLAGEVRGRTLLEVACGTGYWTRVAAVAAKAIVATDFNPAPLEIARTKSAGPSVRFEQADAFALPDYGLPFDAGMAHFWWSHVPKADQQRFLTHFTARLAPGAKLLMIDNNFVPGSSTPIARTDADGNTYQVRMLKSGEEYEILKNFPSDADLQQALQDRCGSVTITQLPHYWAVSATLR